MMVYQHHELPSGEGYPVGVADEEIHPWARVCAVVDVFEALTSQRPYRRAFSSETALAVQMRGSGRMFDAEVMKCWQTLVLTRSNS
jgi:HD-GYP domain-containing protein (c-di-GMP phosphodiesterase class II)